MDEFITNCPKFVKIGLHANVLGFKFIPFQELLLYIMFAFRWNFSDFYYGKAWIMQCAHQLPAPKLNKQCTYAINQSIHELKLDILVQNQLLPSSYFVSWFHRDYNTVTWCCFTSRINFQVQFVFLKIDLILARLPWSMP